MTPEFIEAESAVSATERRWLRWCAKVERLLGHDLDGDQDAEGFSLDVAGDAFAHGFTPADYVAMVVTDPSYRKPA